MMEIRFYPLDHACDLKFAVIRARADGRMVFCRHRNRSTWEFPGGHREPGEDIHDTAARELWEETGARTFDIAPACIYSVCREGDESFGMLFCTEIFAFEPLPTEFEIAEIAIDDVPPGEWTYPQIQPALLAHLIQCEMERRA